MSGTIFPASTQNPNLLRHLPVRFRSAQTQDKQAVADYLRKELDCPAIRSLYPHMHWAAKRSGSSIDALHRNIVKGRQVVVTEDPDLHLVWHKNTIYIKPLPLWLLDSGFRTTYGCTAGTQNTDTETARNAMGFLRSYALLIQHESDFLLAVESKLISEGGISYPELQQLLEPFRDETDDAVSLRYHFGQLRLSRLNWAVRLSQPAYRREPGGFGRLYYHVLYRGTTDFVEAAIVPFAFMFATVAVILSAMQVMLAVGASATKSEPLESTSWRFSILILIFIAVFLVVLLLIVVVVLLSQLVWGWRHSRTVVKDGEERQVQAA